MQTWKIALKSIQLDLSYCLPAGVIETFCETNRVTSIDSPWEFPQISEVRFLRVRANSIHVHPNCNQKRIDLTYLKLTELYS